MACLLSAAILIRVIMSPLPGILDLQRCTPDGWQTYNNIALLVEADGQWNSAELNGGTITESSLGVFDYAPLPNGARVRVSIDVTGAREVQATATVMEGNVTRLALSNDFGLATNVRYVRSGSFLLDARSVLEPNDGLGVPGAFYPLPVSNLILYGSVIQYQRCPGAIEAFAEIRRNPWLPSQPVLGHNWIERVHLTRTDSGTWTFGYKYAVRMAY